MTAIEPAAEKAVRSLQDAIARLRDDIARVEIWAVALENFARPAPDYDPMDQAASRYRLPRGGGAEPPPAHAQRNGITVPRNSFAGL